MTYLWDTDTCIYYLNGNQHIRQTVKNVGLTTIATTIVTVAELKFGAFHSTRVAENLARIAILQQKIRVLSDFSDPIATVFAENKARLKKQGLLIGDFDLVIASVALHFGLIVVTNNVAHFQRIPNIRIENWMC